MARGTPHLPQPLLGSLWGDHREQVCAEVIGARRGWGCRDWSKAGGGSVAGRALKPLGEEGPGRSWVRREGGKGVQRL